MENILLQNISQKWQYKAFFSYKLFVFCRNVSCCTAPTWCVWQTFRGERHCSCSGVSPALPSPRCLPVPPPNLPGDSWTKSASQSWAPSLMTHKSAKRAPVLVSEFSRLSLKQTKTLLLISYIFIRFAYDIAMIDVLYFSVRRVVKKWTSNVHIIMPHLML